MTPFFKVPKTNLSIQVFPENAHKQLVSFFESGEGKIKSNYHIMLVIMTVCRAWGIEIIFLFDHDGVIDDEDHQHFETLKTIYEDNAISAVLYSTWQSQKERKHQVMDEQRWLWFLNSNYPKQSINMM